MTVCRVERRHTPRAPAREVALLWLIRLYIHLNVRSPPQKYAKVNVSQEGESARVARRETTQPLK